jgi:hypothetical protein
MPGLPILWSAINVVAPQHAWYALAILQHALAGAALVRFAMALRGRIPDSAILLGATLLDLHPFFMAFHNALMTESITSSMLLLTAAQALSICRARPPVPGQFVLFAIFTIVGSLLRSYTFTVGAAYLATIAVVHRDFRTWIQTGLCGLAIAAGVIAFPVYRYAATGKFFMPNVDFVLPTLIGFTLPRSGPEAEVALRQLPLPPGFDFARLRASGLTYTDSIAIAKSLIGSGYSDADARRKLHDVASKMGAGQLARNARFTLVSIGSVVLPYLGDPDAPGQESLTVGKLRDHQQYYYRWFAWLQNRDYSPVLADFIGRYRSQPELYPDRFVTHYADAIVPHVAAYSTELRDPIRIGAVWPDYFILGWLVFIIAILRKAPAVALIFLAPVIVNYVDCLSVPLAEIRYAHPLFPFYVIGTATAVIAGLASCGSAIRAVRRRK